MAKQKICNKRCETFDDVLQEIKKKRLIEGKTQKEVGKKLGLTHASYSRLESGKSEMTVKQLSTLCDDLQIDVTVDAEPHYQVLYFYEKGEENA